jgi:uncharacterized membrane protein (DUF373 family)
MHRALRTRRGALRASVAECRADRRAGRIAMGLKAWTKADWGKIAGYERFEQIALVCVMVLLGVLTTFAILYAAVRIVTDVTLGETFLDKAALQDTFGLVLTIVILIEFNHSIFVALTHHTGAIQARIVVLIVVLVIARKLMLLDISALDAMTLLGFGGIMVALGGLYWLITDADRRYARVKKELEQPQAPGSLPAGPHGE